MGLIQGCVYIKFSNFFLIANSKFILQRKEQYPVTAHVPNFDFLTGCRTFKRCQESKRTLKNPFALPLAKFDTTKKQTIET